MGMRGGRNKEYFLVLLGRGVRVEVGWRMGLIAKRAHLASASSTCNMCTCNVHMGICSCYYLCVKYVFCRSYVFLMFSTPHLSSLFHLLILTKNFL